MANKSPVGAGLGAGLSGSSDKVLHPEVKTLNCPATERTSPHRTVARGAVTTDEDQKHPGDPDEETQPPTRSRPPWQRRSSTSRVPKLRHSSPSRSRPPPGPRERLSAAHISAAHPRPEHGSRVIRAGVGDTVARQRERAGKRRAEEPEEPEEPPEVPAAGDRELSPQNPWRQPQAFPPPCPWQNAPPPPADCHPNGHWEPQLDRTTRAVSPPPHACMGEAHAAGDRKLRSPQSSSPCTLSNCLAPNSNSHLEANRRRLPQDCVQGSYARTLCARIGSALLGPLCAARSCALRGLCGVPRVALRGIPGGERPLRPCRRCAPVSPASSTDFDCLKDGLRSKGGLEERE
ncbi:hypothetical protein NDU88_001901 [Pleurodeles waltl]|uniref:Uncharacterized protein n=1 Tax=Pleurodeles waltl TaxID=8319 RepID=A0AAV7RDX7_PLEWA|nr:hypothetical protein NDU88_001901 [Pleurodeles waltl]